ncbi:MAG: hypothetical protein WKF97_09640 [Chitinophagaceae bacterium]
MTNETFSAEESLQLIRNMIEKTRQGFSGSSHYFLIWGWATLLALLGQFVLKAIFKNPYHYHVWWISVLCFVITMLLQRNERRRLKVKTYVGEGMGYLWTGLGITFFVFCLLFFRLGWQNCYPFFITLYGVGTYVSGKILQFQPLVWGGIICWMLAAIAVWFSMDEQMLFAAGAILISYIIPGHLLRIKYHHS